MLEKMEEAAVAEAWIGVVLHDIKAEIIGPAKGPDREEQKAQIFPGEVGQKKQGGGEKAQEEEEGAFEFQNFGRGDIGHVFASGIWRVKNNW